MNILLETDVYKCGHLLQYAPGTDFVYSYLTARSSKNYPATVFFGLQYYLQKYLSKPITEGDALEFIQTSNRILGQHSEEAARKVQSLARLGYWPLSIKAVPEGSVVPAKNALMTICNTHKDFSWCVGLMESLLLKVWYPTTVATCCRGYRDIAQKYWDLTVGREVPGLDFAVHDFGYRGDSSVEGAALSGVAHLLSFKGSDTVPALKCAETYYDADDSEGCIMASVPASEHSVMCSYGRDGELAAFERMLQLYREGVVSIVSDTFDVYEVLTTFAEKLKPQILRRQGKVVFRPDSGDPETIICGDILAEPGSPRFLGAVRLLDATFGSAENDLGFKVLNPKVGLIYGDGMYPARYSRTLERLKSMGYASSNLAIGVGGILRNHTRDTLGFAIKATHVRVNGRPRDIEKDPVTDPGKKSHKGKMYVTRSGGSWQTFDQCSDIDETYGELREVFRDGKIIVRHKFADIRKRVIAS